MYILIEKVKIVKKIISQCVYSGGQDRATLESDLSGLPAHRGKHTGFFMP
jgi:hypothetical protein